MSQTLKFGNGTWARKKGSTLAYSDTNNAFKPLPFSFERNSIATRVNKEGLIEVVGNDIPRIDYTDSTEGALLLENSSTNLIPYSEDFSQSVWSLGSNTVLTYEPNITAPDGSLGVYRLTLSAQSSTFLQFQTGSGNTNYTGSIYAKSASGNDEGFNLFYGGTSSNRFITNNDWLRYDYNDSGTQFTIVNDGDEFVTDIYIWGAMLEANSVASSYIPTNGSTVQRAAETCNDSGNSEVFNDSEGVLFADINFLENNVSANNQVSLSDGSGNNRVMIYPFSNTQLGIRFNANSSQLVSQTLDVQILSNYSKLSIKWGNGNYNLYQNGFKIYSQSISDTPINLSKINFSSVTETSPFYGKTKEIAYYDEILTDLELETLTSYRSLNEMVTELNLNAL